MRKHLHKLGDLIEDFINQSPYKHRLEEAAVLNLWSQAVGEQISNISAAYKFQDGILWVRVNHSGWRQELYYRKREILKKIRAITKQELVKDIKFK
ncbi:MAG: hypothetical protein Kow00108_12880 [Calditrichia bacterium]